MINIHALIQWLAILQEFECQLKSLAETASLEDQGHLEEAIAHLRCAGTALSALTDMPSQRPHLKLLRGGRWDQGVPF